jgi:hypothetical protein
LSPFQSTSNREDLKAFLWEKKAESISAKIVLLFTAVPQYRQAKMAFARLMNKVFPRR